MTAKLTTVTVTAERWNEILAEATSLRVENQQVDEINLALAAALANMVGIFEGELGDDSSAYHFVKLAAFNAAKRALVKAGIC